MLIEPSEFDISYFDRLKAQAQGLVQHPGGYFHYDAENPRYKQIYISLMDGFQLNQYIGKDVLEIGCAKGFYVENFRNLGINAWGIDISEYAVDKASDTVKPYLTVADARIYLPIYENNKWDLVWSFYFLECLEVNELANVILEMNRISKYQYHVFTEAAEINTKYYIAQPLSWWAQQGFVKAKLKLYCRDREVNV